MCRAMSSEIHHLIDSAEYPFVQLGEERGKEGKAYKDKLDAQAKEKKCTRDRVKTAQEGNEGTTAGR